MRIAKLLVVLLTLLLADQPRAVLAQGADAPGEWRHYAGDKASTHYSPLDQINANNVQNLTEVWRWLSADTELDKEKRLGQNMFKPTPLMVKGVLYVVTCFSQVAALDAATGKQIWVHDPKSYDRGRPTNTGFQHRGLEYWTDGKDERILLASGGRQLVALNAKTGKPYPDFGDSGWVDLDKDLGREINPRMITYNSPPIVCRDTIILGSNISDGPTQKEMPPGHIRGYDVRTGKQKWIFHTIPQKGEPGVETWEDDSWTYSGNTNAWTLLSADEELGYVYIPTGTPTNDYYGGHRPGNNLYGETLLCLKAETGEKVWHFQAVHHGLWDYDFPAAPNLVDITVDGRKIKAVAQITKQGFTFVFDRVTGKPVWPIEERPVPQSDAPGEKSSPTQPFPTKPPPFERQGVTDDDLVDFTPELKKAAKELVSQYVHGPIYTPPSVITPQNKGTISLPGLLGGGNWGGTAFDPDSGILYIPSITRPYAIGLIQPDQNRSNFRYVRSGNLSNRVPQGLPFFKPPYSRITAIDLNKGEIVWQIPHGDGPRNHPALKGLNVGPLGTEATSRFTDGGVIATKTLLFAIQSCLPANSGQADSTTTGAASPSTAAAAVPQPPAFSSEGFIRAYEKGRGKLLWEKRISTAPYGTPLTYMMDGKQYVVFAAGGQGQPAELIAFSLPN